MSSNLKVNTILPSVGSNIGLGTNGGNLNVDGGCKVQVGTALTLGHTVGVQFATQNLHSAGFEVNQINASGIITASQFKGDGSQLSGISVDTTKIETGNTKVETIDTGSDGHVKFTTEGTEKLRIDSSGNLSFAGDTDTYIHHPQANQLAITLAGGSFPIIRFGTGGSNSTVGFSTDTTLVTNAERISVRGFSSFKSYSNVYAAIYTHNEGNTSGTYNPHILWNAGGANRGGIGYMPNNGEVIFNNQNPINFATGATGLGGSPRLRIDNSGHVSLRNSANSHQELQWYVNSNKSASIGWGNGSANWEFKHFRADNQADNPYANIDFFTGSTTSPTRALRITEDGNHIREKHSRFATRIQYDSTNEAVNEVLDFSTPHVNVGNDFDASNNYYVAPVDGDYAFWFFTNVAKNGSGAYYVSWHKNGSEVNANGGRIYDQHSGSGWNNLSGCIMLALQEGDQITIHNRVEANFDGGSYGQFMGWLVG